MTTAHDLFLTALDVPATHPLTQGDLSLALAGAELVDLLGAEAVHLDAGDRDGDSAGDSDRIVPGLQPTTGDRLLDEAAAALRREHPYESVDDWLWRRSRGLAAAYARETRAESGPHGHRWLPTRARHAPPPDSPERRHAADRWAFREPVLVALAAALGIPEGGAPQEDTAPDLDDAVLTVVAAVHNALTELAAVRQRRRIEDDAYANIWRGV
ncbi:GPP34 family phosphoprotein [Streptomyces sp. NPDC003395]